MKILPAVVFLAGLAVLPVVAQNTNGPSKAEIDGAALVQKIFQQWPSDNYTNTGVLKIKDANGRRTDVPVTFIITVTPTNWTSLYSAGQTSLQTTHVPDGPNTYQLWTPNGKMVELSGSGLMTPFANSDFWLADLGLDFFHWPDPKVLRREVHRSCGCSVLECTNPNPTAGGYSRVDLWIDNDSLGIVDAYAYDAQGKELKNFYPKDFKKVNGQYQVQSMIMESSQTEARTRLEFDLKSK